MNSHHHQQVLASPTAARRRRGNRGFSLVEVALSLGILAFAFLSLLALLPLGMMNNQVSIEQTHAVGELTMLEADLRYTHPEENTNGNSAIYDLPLPYTYDADTGITSINPDIDEGTIYSVGMDENGELVELQDGVRTRYQISVEYYRIPTPGSGQPIEARLTVNWPSVDSTGTSSDLINAAKVNGYVEGFVAFPTP